MAYCEDSRLRNVNSFTNIVSLIPAWYSCFNSSMSMSFRFICLGFCLYSPRRRRRFEIVRSQTPKTFGDLRIAKAFGKELFKFIDICFFQCVSGHGDFFLYRFSNRAFQKFRITNKETPSSVESFHLQQVLTTRHQVHQMSASSCLFGGSPWFRRHAATFFLLPLIILAICPSDIPASYSFRFFLWNRPLIRCKPHLAAYFFDRLMMLYTKCFADLFITHSFGI